MRAAYLKRAGTAWQRWNSFALLPCGTGPFSAVCCWRDCRSRRKNSKPRAASAKSRCGTSLENKHRCSYQGHLVMGQIEEAAHNLPEAQRHYHLAKDVLDTLRSGVHGEELKISFMSNRLEVYENLVDTCLARGATLEARTEAWTYMEQAKSRNLLELIARQVGPTAGDNREKKGTRKLRGLREQLNWYYHRIEVEQLGQLPASDKRLLMLRRLAQSLEKFLFPLPSESPKHKEPFVR